MFMMVDYARAMTSRKSNRYGKYGSFECFACIVNCQEVTLMSAMADYVREGTAKEPGSMANMGSFKNLFFWCC